MTNQTGKKSSSGCLPILILLVVLYFFSDSILSHIGSFLIHEDKVTSADCAVVLNTGAEYYPRLIEAASLFNQGRVKKIVINGDRKTDVLRELEAKGFEGCCTWYENRLRILELYGVPRDQVITISAEDAYDTITESEIVGQKLAASGIKSVLVTTSKFHTRRAGFIWRAGFSDDFAVYAVAATDDPFDPKTWYKSGRQIRWVLAEYGAWAYYGWTRAEEFVKDILS